MAKIERISDNGRIVVKTGRIGRVWFQWGDEPKLPEGFNEEGAVKAIALLRSQTPEERRGTFAALPPDQSKYLAARIFAEPVEIDVVNAWNRWVELDDNLRMDKTDEATKEVVRIVPPENRKKHAEAMVRFVEDTTGKTGFSGAEIWAFVESLNQEVKKLKSFFDSDTAEEPSSPPSTDAIFSQ
jgi:hypothetical protein